MRSPLAKVLHPVAGLPMVRHVVDMGRKLRPSATAVVVGYAGDEVAAVVGDDVAIVQQREPLGTGHAVLQAREALRGRADVIAVLYADTVLLTPATVERMVAAAEKAPVVMLTGEVDDTTGLGRVKRDSSGRVIGIIEVRDGIPEHEAIREINGGAMVFQAEWLWEELPRVRQRPNGEYFLTDLVATAIEQGHDVPAVQPDDPAELWGINTQVQLADANRVMLDRIRRGLMEGRGVRMPDPSSVFVDSSVEFGEGVVLHPNTHVQGKTRVAAGTEIGPNSLIRDTILGRDCRVVASMLEEAWVGDEVTIGPFAHVRPGARIEDRVELGNYAEVKASTVGAGSRVHHFSYLGDATVGRDANIGAGTITCNYDGTTKHRTVVGDGAFIGSDTMLVAPVTVGEGAKTGAGSVVRRDVKPGQLVVGVPARPVPGRRAVMNASSEESEPARAPRLQDQP